ncbi:DUF4328 domain-containing protein [Polymorphospora sp. NPDC050346]|uniref:DUF4328 domain-containing protein n=1 Tax=Polymorphospora sp. NPDC050346 TaxID=3155780 RepID=UPI0034113A59
MTATVPSAEPAAPPARPRPPRILGRFALASGVALTVSMVAGAAFTLLPEPHLHGNLVNDFLDNPPLRRLAMALLAVATVGVVSAGPAAIVLHLVWAYRLHRYVDAVRGADPRRPVWTTPLGWLVPVANLVLGPLALARIATRASGTRLPAVLVWAWWAGFVAATLLFALGRAAGAGPLLLIQFVAGGLFVAMHVVLSRHTAQR